MISYRSSLKGAGNGSGDSGHTITDGTTIYTQRSVLEFDSPLTVQDDSENEATKVGIETGAVVDFSEFELPSSSGNQSDQNNNSLRNYSTDEQIVGTWTDGRPIYEKIIEIQNPAKQTQIQLVTNAAEVIDIKCYTKRTQVEDYELDTNFYNASNDFLVQIKGINKSQHYIWYYWNAANSEYTTITYGRFIVQYTKTTDTPTN